MNYAISVIGRVKKSLDSKDISSKENKLPSQKGISQSTEKATTIIPRSASTIKIMMQSTQTSLCKDSARHFNSTAKLTTTKNLSHNVGPFALNDIANRMYWKRLKGPNYCVNLC